MMEDNKNPKCRTFLLDDLPAQEDAFSSVESIGPHQRVANAIVDLIALPEEHGGKMIGVEGGWGSGKSTIVKFVQEAMVTQEHCTVIPFDAWAHEGDPLRRTYLETIIRHLQKNKWIEEHRWNAKKEEIANRRKVKHTKTVPKPTLLGTLLGISLLLVPAGTAFLGSSLSTRITFDIKGSPAWGFIFGILLSFAPILVIFIHAISLLLKKKPFSLRSVFNRDDWSFLEGKAISETKTETVETPNPTSIEFEGYFTDIMVEALCGDKKRRLLLVLDNLDRVEQEDAIRIWSTLQTFFQEGNHKNDTWFKQLWVLVPYDPQGLRKLWDKVDRDDLVSDSFIDKSFQVRFQVPPPVLSDWKSYLFKLLKKALPDHGDNDYHTLYRVFEHFRNIDAPPTPRELKLYVNQVGAIHRQWHDEFPIGHIAYYVIQGRNHQSITDL